MALHIVGQCVHVSGLVSSSILGALVRAIAAINKTMDSHSYSIHSNNFNSAKKADDKISVCNIFLNFPSAKFKKIRFVHAIFMTV